MRMGKMGMEFLMSISVNDLLLFLYLCGAVHSQWWII